MKFDSAFPVKKLAGLGTLFRVVTLLLSCWVFCNPAEAVVADSDENLNQVVQDSMEGSNSLSNDGIIDGGHHHYNEPNCPKTTNSGRFTSFEMHYGLSFGPAMGSMMADNNNSRVRKFNLKAWINPNGTLSINATGSNDPGHRDGSYFIVRYTTADEGFMGELAALIKGSGLMADNGSVSYTTGLPSGDGDLVSGTFDNQDLLYIRNNRSPVMSDDVAGKIYDLFRSKTQSYGLDFTSDGSNIPLYDDATEEFLQGVWIGKHFGNEVKAEFTGGRVKIWYAGKLTDDVEYVIRDGKVLPKSADDDAQVTFEGVDKFAKQNNFMLVAYFYRKRGAYSTANLLRQN